MAGPTTAYEKVSNLKSFQYKEEILRCCLNVVPWKHIMNNLSTIHDTIHHIKEKYCILRLLISKPDARISKINIQEDGHRTVREAKQNLLVPAL